MTPFTPTLTIFRYLIHLLQYLQIPFTLSYNQPLAKWTCKYFSFFFGSYSAGYCSKSSFYQFNTVKWNIFVWPNFREYDPKTWWLIFAVFNFHGPLKPTKIKNVIDLLNLTVLKQWAPHEKMNFNQYGQIYLKNEMVKFVIDKTVQFETILYSLDSLCEDASVHFKLNFITQFTVSYSAIVCKTAIVQCKCNYKVNHTKCSYCAFNNTSDL